MWNPNLLPGGAKASLLLSVVGLLACSGATESTGSTGSLSGSVTDPGGFAVSGARVVVTSGDETIVPRHASGVLSDDDGDFRVDLLSANFSQRKTTGQAIVTPPEGSSLAEKVVAGIVLSTGPDDPETVLDVTLEEE